jgi:Fe2+ or Zn2+ uptake regulation protein
MSNTKIAGKFYPLQREEWLHACRELTPTQRNVLYLVRCSDPYGHGIETSPTEIARQLSDGDKQVHRSTISRALKVLKEKEFIEVEPVINNTKVKAKGIHYSNQTEEEETVVVSKVAEKTSGIQNNEFDSDSVALSEDNRRDRDATGAITTQQARSRRNTAVLEPPLDRSSASYKNIKTTKTLSESERENFLEFAMNKVDNLPNRPALPRKWIEANFNELYEQFCDKNKPTEISQAWERWQNELEQRRIQAQQAYPEQLTQEQTEDSQVLANSSSGHSESQDQPPITPKRDPQQAWQDWQNELEQRRIQAQQAHPEQLTQEQAVPASKSTPVEITASSSPSAKQSRSSRFPRPQKPSSSPSHSKTTRLGTDTFEQLNDVWHDNG